MKVIWKILNIIVFIMAIPFIPFFWERFKLCSEYKYFNKFEKWFNQKFGWFFSPPTKQGKENKNKIYK